jgi:hypothetical protein
MGEILWVAARTCRSLIGPEPPGTKYYLSSAYEGNVARRGDPIGLSLC